MDRTCIGGILAFHIRDLHVVNPAGKARLAFIFRFSTPQLHAYRESRTCTLRSNDRKCHDVNNSRPCGKTSDCSKTFKDNSRSEAPTNIAQGQSEIKVIGKIVLGACITPIQFRTLY